MSTSKDRFFESLMNISIKKLIISAVVIILAVVLLASSCSVVNADERGVLLQFGKIKGDVIQPGLIIHAPFISKVRKYSVVPFDTSLVIPVGDNSIISKDNQDIGASVDIYWSFNPDMIIDIASGYTKDRLQTIVSSVGKNVIKTVIGKYDVYSLAEKQDVINEEIRTLMASGLSSYPVILTDVKLINFDWSPAFSAQIEETMRITQQVKIAEQQRQIKSVEAETQVIEAEAQKKAALLKAEADYQTTLKLAEADYERSVKLAEAEKEKVRLEAEAKVLEGEAIKAYNAALKDNLEIELELRRLEVELTKAEKWNGQYVPTNNYGPIPVSTGSIQGI